MTTDRFEQLLRDAEQRLNDRLDRIEAKVDEAADFKAGLQGAARIGMAIIVALGILVGIYVGLKGLPGPTHSGVTP